MPIALVTSLALAATFQPSCSWDRPGANRYRGNVRDALERYSDIPDLDRIALKHKIEQGQADDQVEITRDSIRGKAHYNPNISDMHFGAASVCHEVTRSRWDPARVEPGAVYCVKDHCILVPKICGNVSRIKRLAPVAAPPKQAGRVNGDGAVADLDPGLADADSPARDDDEDAARARERSHRAIEQVNHAIELSDLTALAGPNGLEDPNGKRDHQAGHNGNDSDPFDPFDPFDPLNPFDPNHDDPFNPTPVPEPEQWAMLLSGLGLTAWAARRRRRCQQAATANAR